MTRKMYWGIAILILLLGTAAVYIIMHEIADNRDLTKLLEEADNLEKQIKQQPVSNISTEKKPTNVITQPTEERTEPIEVKNQPELISPFGLGPYPKLPDGYPDPKTFWASCENIEVELLERVDFKMREDGTRDKYSSIGTANLNGKFVIEAIEKGSILVEYITDANGNKKIVGVTGAPDLVPPGVIYQDENDVPSHIKVVTLEDIAIDPYQYLGLQEP